MDEIRNGWFSEISTVWPGQSWSLQVDKVLHKEKSDYQDIMVFKSKTYGNVLVLDGIIQLTEREEFGYHEIMVNVPLYSHPNPKKVLVVGGGDGGIIREIVKHAEVEEVHQCEIDKRVIEVSKEFLPTLSSGYSSPKLTIHIEDANEYMGRHTGKFDIIITDSSDPIGPAKPLFEKPYFAKIHEALKPGGILLCQGESVYSHLELIKSSITSLRELFPVVGYCYSATPAYPTGQCGFIMGCKNKNAILSKPLRKITLDKMKAMGLRYYSAEMHHAAFVLPQFAREALDLYQ